MAQKQPKPAKHVPQRMCIACRQGAGKRDLVRVVRTASGVQVDPTGKLAGRGAYLHPVRSCWQQALESRLLQRALRNAINAEDLQALTAYAASLPDVDPLDEDTDPA
ncbi:MAG: YlxR family protein [Caldilineaceae bacterium]|nr:YlxR family protein [Caldilineaceae bacterium]